MSDWANPITSTPYVDVIGDDTTGFRGRDFDTATMFKNAPSNHPTGSVRWNRSTLIFEEWSGAAWVPLALAIAGGGTGSTTAAAARTALGLGTIAVQNSNNVTITGGTIGTSVNIDAARLTSNLVPTARLADVGTPGPHTFLNGDQDWVSAVPVGASTFWHTAVAPIGWLFADGAAVSRTTYATLFALWGTKYGVGDGSTTFNILDARGKFPFIKAVSGTGNTLDGTFGSIDHTHTGPSHTHTGPSHTHTFTTSVFGDHTHGGSGTTGAPAGLVQVQAGVDETVGSVGHTHDFSFITDTNGAHSHPGSTTDAGGTGATGAAGTGATGTANPPAFVMNLIIKALP